MNKILIKVIKRKDAEVMAKAKTQNVSDTKQTAPVNGDTSERRSHREIVGTISNWVSERRENNRLEKIAAVRQMFGNEPLLSEI